MSTFDTAVAFVLAQEGAPTDDPRDPGGLTRYGISQRANPEVDVASLTRDDAIAVYRVKYWRDAWNTLPAGLALAVFDCAVNQGPGIAQLLLDSCQHDLKRFLAMRIRHYSVTKQWDVYGLGWTVRVLTCLQAAIAST